MRAREDAQIIIVTGFITAIALIAITLMVNDAIYSSNTASIETIQSTKFDTEEVLTLVKREVDFARRLDPDASSLNFHMTNFSRNISKFYAARGIAVELNWSNVAYGNAVVRNISANPAAIAYCGAAGRGGSNESGIRSWMVDLGLVFTDYSTGGRCDDQGQSAANMLFFGLCRGSTSAANNSICNTADPSVTLNVSTAIFEFDQLAPKASATSSSFYCGVGPTTNDSTGGNILNKTQCQTLQNWTYLGGTLIKTGSNTTNSASNTSILDLFTANYNGWRPNNSAFTLDVRRVDDSATWSLGTSVVSSACLVNNSSTGLFKNAPNSSIINFSRGGLVVQKGSSQNLTNYVSEAASNCDGTAVCTYGGTGVCGTAVNWTYGYGKVYYFPQLQGDLRSGGRVIINDPDNLRPVFNLFPYGGDCRVTAKITLASVAYVGALYC